jgi:hypothetical protein
MADRTLTLIMAKNKHGHSLSHTSQLTGLTIDKMKEILGQATGLTHEEVSIIFHMKQGGLSLGQISEEYGVELEVLEQFLPQEATPVIKESVVGFEAQIEALFDQGKGAPEIGRMLGVSERAVLAYTLEGESKTYFSKASEPAPVDLRLPPTTTEEAKQPLKPQLTKTWAYLKMDGRACRRSTAIASQTRRTCGGDLRTKRTAPGNVDKKHGQGVYTLLDGRRYEGKRHGYGKEEEPDGGCYIRTWSEDKKHGEFSYSKGGTSRKEKS